MAYLKTGILRVPVFRLSSLDILLFFCYTNHRSQNNKSSGSRKDRLRVGVCALTREPDTANTVGGKDRNTNCGIALHPETGLRRDL